MAGHPGELSLPDSLTSHVVTTAALLDAMVEHGVRRLVYGGSNHAVGRTPRAGLPDGLLTAETRLRPDTFYGVAKASAETLMSLYADRHGLDVVSCRIGSFRAEPTTTRNLATWLSHDDCVRMVDAALTTPAPGFAVLYGISHNTRGWWDLAPGRALGYDPQDDAEDWADAGRGAPRGRGGERPRRRAVPRGVDGAAGARPADGLDLECTPRMTLEHGWNQGTDHRRGRRADRPDRRHAALLRARRADASLGAAGHLRPPAVRRGRHRLDPARSPSCARPACRSATYAATPTWSAPATATSRSGSTCSARTAQVVLARLAEVQDHLGAIDYKIGIYEARLERRAGAVGVVLTSPRPPPSRRPRRCPTRRCPSCSCRSWSPVRRSCTCCWCRAGRRCW